MPKKGKKGKKGAGDAALEAGGEKGRLREAEIIKQSLEARLSDASSRFRGIKERNVSLQEARVRVARETGDFVEYFNSELEAREKAIDDLKSRLRDSEMSRASETEELRGQLRRARAEAEGELKRVKGRLEGEVRDLRENLERLEEYRVNKLRIDAEVSALQRALAEEKAARREEVQDTERRLLLRQAELVEQHKGEYESMKQRARLEAQHKLDEDVKRLVVQNRRYADELAFHRQQSKVLSAEVHSLREANLAFAREIEMAADAEKVYAERATRRRKEVGGLRERLATMEKGMAEMARGRGGGGGGGSGGGSGGGVGGGGGGGGVGGVEEGKRREAEAGEVEALKGLVRRKNKELRTVKRLAEMILSQRSEAEQLVLDALTLVKREIRDRKVRAMEAAAATPALPQLGRRGKGRVPTSSPLRGSVRSLLQSTHHPSASARAFQRLLIQGTADPGAERSSPPPHRTLPLPRFSDLDAEDKATVLETLFERLKAGAPPLEKLPLTNDVDQEAAPSPPRTHASPPTETGPEYGGIGAPFGLATWSASEKHTHTHDSKPSLVEALASEAGVPIHSSPTAHKPPIA